MAFYVINEWVWADLADRNGPERRLETFLFLEALAGSTNQILVVSQSPFEKKLWSACKSDDMRQRATASFFLMAIHQDLDRCRILHAQEITPLPDVLRKAGVKPDDDYLIQAQGAQPESTIVTTDDPLLRILRSHGIPCVHRDPFVVDFLKLYNKSPRQS